MKTTKAYRDGYVRGKNAAGWWTQENDGGRDTKPTDWAADFIKRLDDGDQMAMDAVECPVNLSGEWAGDSVPEDVADLYAKRPSDDVLDDLCTDWENGAQEGWMKAIYEHLRRLVKHVD